MNVEDSLKLFNISYQKQVEYFRVLCPFHDDSHPSGNLHHKTGKFNCFSCGKHSSFPVYLAKKLGVSLSAINIKLGRHSDCKNPIPPDEVERDHIAIWNYPEILSQLRHRMISDSIIRKYRLGAKAVFQDIRVSIPIQNEVGEFAGLRLYLPGAKDKKFVNLIGKDRSKVRLYPFDQLEFDQILICGGELKALLAAEILNQYGIGAIAPTCGENYWPGEYNEKFRDKLVYVCLDVDDTGKKYAELRCRILRPFVREIHKVEMTLEQVGGIENGDINDFVRLGGDLHSLLVNTPEWQFVAGGECDTEQAVPCNFADAFSHSDVGKKVEFTGIVSALNEKGSYLIAEEVQVSCNRAEEFCVHCDVNSQAFNGLETTMKIAPDNKAILALVGEKSDDHAKTYKQTFRIPPICRQCTFRTSKNYTVLEVKVDEYISADDRRDPIINKSCFLVNPDNDVSQNSYKLTGRLYPFPKTQIATFLASQALKTKDSLESYDPLSSKDLLIFRPNEWTVDSIQEKLDEIYTDLEANITKIYHRRDLHLATDLAYHSVLQIKIGEEKSINGYVEMLVVGDTAQGKSETIRSLQNHYGLGYKVDCGNVTLAGLTIGIDASTSRRFVVYGVYPKNDRKLVIFEELKKMNPKVFQALTEVRSSGTVQIAKIEGRIRRARVRLIAISNPVDKRDVASYTYGIDAAMGIIGTNEDLRRFDFVLILGRDDIKDIPELRNPPVVEHKFTASLCQQLVLKAWKSELIEFEDQLYAIEAAKALVEKFGYGPPVLDAHSSHNKLLKLATALAARTCSYDVHETLVVRKCHIDYIVKYLDRIYSSKSVKLDAKSHAIREATVLKDKDKLAQFFLALGNSQDIVAKLADSDMISSVFLRDLLGDAYTGAMLFSKLIQANALQRIKGDSYVKTAEFTKFLSDLRNSSDIPNYIKKDMF